MTARADTERISSRTNPKVQAAAALLAAKERNACGRFLAEGARLCADAAGNGVEIETLFVTPAAAEKYAALLEPVFRKAGRVCEIGDAVAEKLSDTAHPQGVFCVCKKPERRFLLKPAGFYVMTENLQNPDNLGAISRTAEAFGADGLLVAGGCDMYQPKALRASMGALLRFPVASVPDAPAEICRLKDAGIAVYAAALTPQASDLRTVPKTGGVAVVIGNEGSGVSPETLAACTGSVVIPMAGKAESLNAAAAAAVLLWEFTKDRNGD